MNRTRCLLWMVILLATTAVAGASQRQLQIDRILTEGNRITKAYVILQELTFHEGEVLDQAVLEDRIAQSQANLKNLGIFADVSIGYTGNEDSTADAQPGVVTVKVVERWTLFPVPAFGLDTLTGVTLGVNLMDSNLFGRRQSLNGAVSWKRDNSIVALSFGEPRMFGSRYSLLLNGQYHYYHDTRYDGVSALIYDAWTTQGGLYANLGKSLETPLPVSLYAESDVEYKTSSVSLDLAQTGGADTFSWVVGPGVTLGQVQLDGSRKDGWTLEMWGDVAPLFWLKWDAVAGLSFKDYVPLGSWLSLCGWLYGWYDTRGRALGSDTVRGIKYGEVAGTFGFHGTLELRPLLFTIPWPTPVEVFLPVFVDVARAAKDASFLDIQQFSLCAGASIRLFPRLFGLVLRLDAGFNIPAILRTGKVQVGDGLQIVFSMLDTF